MLPLAASQGEGGRRQPPPPFTGPRQERGAWACPRRPPRPLTTPPLYPPAYHTSPTGKRGSRSGKRAKWGGVKRVREGYWLAAVKLGPGYLQDTGWGCVCLKVCLCGSRVRCFNNYFSYILHMLLRNRSCQSAAAYAEPGETR